MQPARITAPISIRQLFGLIAAAAIVSVVVSNLPGYSHFTWCVLLWPTFAYCGCWCVGRFFLPARSMANQCGLVLSLAALTVWAAFGTAGFGWCVLMLPVAAFWLVQASGLHFLEQLLSKLGFVRRAYFSDRTIEGVLFASTVFLALCAITVALVAQSYSVSAKGSTVNGFWMIGLLKNATSYDCQPGNSALPITLTYRNGTSVTALRNPDWSFLGLQRYKSKPTRGRLHVSHGFTIGILLLYPAIWTLHVLRSGELVLSAPAKQDHE